MRKQRQNFNSNGRTRRKGGLGNGESSGHSKNPNGGPLQNELLRDAMEDIFPELRDHGNVNRGNKSQQQAQVESGSVLGQMIRRRYLLERKSCRTSLDAMMKQEKLNEYPASEFNRNNTDFHKHDTPTPPMSTTTKKRRKRKKKKRQESSASVPPSVISHEHTFHSAPLPFSSSRNEIDTHFTDGKSMMSTTDHSLEALDEALKNEAEKMIELQANHELPLLHSLPSDDNIQDPESPSQFIDQIKPQEEDLLRQLPDHTDPLPFIDAAESIVPSTLPEDSGDGNEDSLELIWKNPLQLPYLVAAQGEEEHYRYSGYDTQLKSGDCSSVPEGPKNVTNFISDKERARILLYDWIDQFFFMNDESECIESSVEKNGQDECDSQKEEWDSFLQFCNERTVGREKALGIPLAHLLDIGSSIQPPLSREQTIAEIKTMAGIETSAPSSSAPTAATKSSRIVMKPIPEIDDVDVDAAFDYVALEEGHHITPDEEKSDSNLSFLAVDVSIDSKQKKSTGKNGSRKKNPAGSTLATERYLFLETLTFEQIEEFFNEWLIAGVDEEKMAKSSIYNEKEQCESDIDKIFPVVISDVELQVTQRWAIQEQQTFAGALDNMNNGLDEMSVEWKRKNTDMSQQKNLSDFTAIDKINKCEESCNEYLTKHILDHLARDISIPTHACAELQIHVWTVYLEGLGKMLNACDEYYKKLEEEFTDQNGVVKNFFVNAGHREAYRQLAEEKIGSLSDMGKSLSKVASSWSMREFFTRSCWEHRKRADQDKKSQELDEDCEKLIEALTEWTKIVTGGRISAIMKERSKGLITVFNMLRVVVESLGEEYKVVEGYFSQDRQNYFSRLLSNIHLAHGVKKKMRLLEMDDVISLTTGIILMWRHVRIMQSRVDRTLSAEILPLSLRKWILDSSNIDLKLDEWYQLNPHVIHSKFCDGRHRVMGILAGLTYGWLRERCKEWKAEKASQELFTYIDADLFSGEDPQPSSKSSKKSKKKKNKKSSSVSNESTNNPAVGPDGENDAAKSNDTNSQLVKPEVANNQHIIVVESTEVAKQELADGMEIPIAIASIDHGPIFDSHAISGEEKENEDVLTTNESMRSVGNDPVDFPHSEEEDHDNIETFESLVVVKDEGGSIVPAMEFLTERLLELMAQSDNEKIVVVSN